MNKLEQIEVRGVIPPTVNHMYINKIIGIGKKKRIMRVKTTIAHNFIKLLNTEAKKVYKEPISIDKEVILYYTLYCDKKGRSDLDNTFKAIQDSLEGIAFENDKQITEIHAKKVRFAGFDGFDIKVVEK